MCVESEDVGKCSLAWDASAGREDDSGAWSGPPGRLVIAVANETSLVCETSSGISAVDPIEDCEDWSEEIPVSRELSLSPTSSCMKLVFIYSDF